MTLFEKGYMPLGGTDGKIPLEDYKDRTEFYKIDDVKRLKGYGGVLNNNLVQIDIDDTTEANIVYKIVCDMDLQCCVLKTSRGMHFYWTNTDLLKRKQNYSTAIGVKIDTGLGSQNAIIPLKVNGQIRTWLKEVDTLESIPSWLKPISKTSIDFKSMSEGDGRNAALFSYILTLQQASLSKEQIKESIKIINTYILQEPLNDREIDTILRDESFAKESFYIKGKLQYELLAKYLKNNENIIKINGELHLYQDGFYTNDLNKIEHKLLKYINNSTKTPRLEIIRYLELLCVNIKVSSTKYILLDNGVMDLETKTLEDFNPRFIIKNKIPVCYNPDAYSEIADITLNNICCQDKNLRFLIEEMMGYCLLRRNELGKAFILTGGGSNGKSTLLDVLEAMLGEDNIAAVELKELNDRFKTYQLEGKLANIGDDISKQFIEDNSTFKKLVTGERVNVERKGKDPYDISNYSKLIFSANDLPRIDDTSDGLKRRVLFIPFNAKFTKLDKDYDPWIKDKLLTTESLEYMLKISLEGLDRILLNKEFTSCAKCDDVWTEYEHVNNPVVAFLEDTTIEDQTVEDIYRQYSIWCIESGLKSLSKNSFGREVKKRGYNSDGTKHDAGSRKRIYRRNE
jgi:putative DNA primase/helicase